jgi:hypothetical protein
MDTTDAALPEDTRLPEDTARPEEAAARAPGAPTGAEWLAMLRRLGAATLSGLVAGAVIGGVGGRLVMFVLRLTTSDSLRGVQTDDGFVIGSFTTDTIGLVVVATVAGGLLAVPYLVARRWLPERHRPLQAAVFFGLVGGAVVIQPGGVDFTFVDPLLLAVVAFIALPALYGAAMAAGTERLIEQPDRWRTGRYVALVPLILGGIMTVVALVVAGAVTMIGRRWPATAKAATGPIVTIGVRALLVLGATLGLVELVSDIGDIL